jgi:diguanylate cyclase (GGDEF)-like protein
MTRYRQVYYLGYLLLLLSFLCQEALAATNFDQIKRFDVSNQGVLYRATTTQVPNNQSQIDQWRKTLTPVSKVSLTGGSYWFLVDIQNTTNHRNWVFDPYGTLVNIIDAYIFSSDGSQRKFETGYQRKLPYSLHYGQNISLEPNRSYRLLVLLKSPYFASQPGFRFMPQDDYQAHVLLENFLTIAALGALLCLAFYNLFIFTSTRDKSLLYYALYLGVTFMGWAWTFHIPTALFNWHTLQWHYIWFFLIPITSTLFYLQFLQVKKWSPLLYKLSWGNIILSALLIPSSFFALSYTHSLATLCISIQLTLALICGIISWRRGFRPARYFVLAFVALLIPGLFILPANVGLIPDLLENAELLTLLGTTLDGLLLAFALAERIRTLQAERDASLIRVTQALALANTDSMTGIGNRHAFDAALQMAFSQTANQNEPEQFMLMLIDLDGLKRINDKHGHARGDDLLRSFASALKTLEPQGISSFRLGGDEFTLITQRKNEKTLRQAIYRIEKELREDGFAEFGASVGVAYGSEHQKSTEVFSRADERMYQDKAIRKTGRATAS